VEVVLGVVVEGGVVPPAAGVEVVLGAVVEGVPPDVEPVGVPDVDGVLGAGEPPDGVAPVVDGVPPVVDGVPPDVEPVGVAVVEVVLGI
jgi:hypothetical protein